MTVRPETPAAAPPAGAGLSTADGVVRAVDLIDRTVTVAGPRGPATYAVPPACEVVLNGERVRLRLLQPRDRVRVTYRTRDGGPAALSLEVRPRP